MRLLILLAATTIPFASTPAQTPRAADTRIKPLEVKPFGSGAECRRTDVHPADGLGKGKFTRLGELPPGQLVLTVFREVDGCPEPVIVRHGIGLGQSEEEREATPPRPKARRW